MTTKSDLIKEKLLTGFFMSFFMALALTFYFVATRMGFVPGWVTAWRSTFISAWPVAFLLATLIGKPVSLLAQFLARKI